LYVPGLTSKRIRPLFVGYFLDRDIIPALIQSLEAGGLIYNQTFTLQRVSDRGPQREEFRLAEQELLQLFSVLQILFYREEGCIGDVQKGFRDEAMLIGREQGCSRIPNLCALW
jgi:tellurite methyltransferase